MKKTIKEVSVMNFVCEPPRYRQHKEIAQFLEKIVRQNRTIAELDTIGHSLEGRKIYCLRLGNQKAANKILWVANAHGEELRGAEETLHIIRALTENDFLKKTFLANHRFTIIPTINPDAREYNLVWATQKIDLLEYFLTARRTIADKNGAEADIEWGYPLDKTDQRVIRRPETKAIKELIDAEKFDLYLDLHGALNGYDIGFWYLIGGGERNRKKLIDFLHTSGKYSGLPLVEQEKMEGDLCLKLKPGVHTLVTAERALKQLEKDKNLVEWFKKKYGASSFDYMIMNNPASQCIVPELPTFYHEKYMDMATGNMLRMDVRKKIFQYSLHLLREEIMPLAEKALRSCCHPKLTKFREEIESASIKQIELKIAQLREEHGNSMATRGEIRSMEEISRYWGCPGYGRGGLGGVISRLPATERKKLKDIYEICRQKAKKCVRRVKAVRLKELRFADSVNIQGRTCLGAILTFFNDK